MKRKFFDIMRKKKLNLLINNSIKNINQHNVLYFDENVSLLITKELKLTK